MPEENQHARDSAELRRLCSERDQLRAEALAGYAVRDARIAELDGEIDDLSHWRDLALQFDNHRMAALWHLKRLVADPQSKSCAALFLGEPSLSAHEVAAERDQLRAELDASKFCANVADDLRAELAAAKETISRYETTAENCDLLRSANSAVVMPDKWIVPAPIWPDARMPYGKPHNGAEISAAESVNLVLDEVARLNPAPATPVEQCTNEDSWNCKYCRKTNGCKALSDPRNFGSPASADVVQVPAVPDGYKVVPIEPTAAQCFTAAFNLCNEFGDEFVRDNKQFALAAYRSLVAASQSAKGGE